jgi:uncharacterized protein (DUF983 family)
VLQGGGRWAALFVEDWPSSHLSRNSSASEVGFVSAFALWVSAAKRGEGRTECVALTVPPHAHPFSKDRQEAEMINQPVTLSQTVLRGLACRCPRCGQGRLFDGFLTLRRRCEVCELDYAFIDTGDGPAIFIIMIAGAIVVAAALIVEVKYQPPFWVHAALWLPLILVTTLLPLRAMKSLLIALQFHHKAAPGQLIDRNPQ